MCVLVEKMIEVTCYNCGVTFQRRASWVENNQRRGMKRSYCNRACWRASLHQVRQGQVNPNWRGGRSTRQDGYIQVRVNCRPKLEHHEVMERHLGRPIAPGEVVHHKNDDRTDNRLENLELMTISQHMALHHQNGIQRKITDRTCVVCGQTFKGKHPTLTCGPRCKTERQRQYWRNYHARKRANTAQSVAR